MCNITFSLVVSPFTRALARIQTYILDFGIVILFIYVFANVFCMILVTRHQNTITFENDHNCYRLSSFSFFVQLKKKIISFSSFFGN